jgi:hypothetical protein
MNYQENYLGADRVQIAGSDREAILDYLTATYPPPQYVDRSGWERYYETLMSLYIDAIVNKKFAPYIPTKSDTLIRYMNDKAQTRLGYATAFMLTLYTLAERGEIQTYVWNPAVYGTVDENKPVGWFESTIGTFGEGVGQAASKSFNTLVIAGAIVAVIYLLGSKAMTKGIKLPSRA